MSHTCAPNTLVNGFNRMINRHNPSEKNEIK